MIRFCISLFLCAYHLGCIAVSTPTSGDAKFDVIIVGTSPICLLEALYRYHSGNSVLVLEKSSECGGVWKTQEICGIPNADISCHIIGKDQKGLHFFEDYLGCQMVSIDHPDQPYNTSTSPNGYYFSEGCHEMMSHLLELIKKTAIVLLLNHHLDSIYVHSDEYVTANVQGQQFMANKLISAQHASFLVENQPPSAKDQHQNSRQYYHLYLLIEDATPPRFVHQYGGGKDISRLMNLTVFSGLTGTQKQLIIVQTQKEWPIVDSDKCLSLLKEKNLVDINARLLSSETYVYEQPQSNKMLLQQAKQTPNAVEVLDTSYLHIITKHIPRWTTVLLNLH